jgi:3-dehydroquinate synthase
VSNASANVQVYLGSRSYEVCIVTGRLAALAHIIEPWFESRGGPAGGQALIVTDRNVAGPHAAPVRRSLEEGGWTCDEFVMEPGEQHKTLATVSAIYDRLVAMKATRQAAVFAVGGGVVGDTAGFAAATYTRGIAFVQVPTTLLAHVDSSVGGKVGVNHPRAKNLIGAFHQPLGVVVDTATLDTLPDRDYRAGLAEVVKYGMILDANFFAALEQHADELNARRPDMLRKVIQRCCRLKADVVEQDEFETTGLRAVLNYGHTFAHAYEALTDYGALLHGEAVAVGMIHAARLAERIGMIDDAVARRQQALIAALGLPTALPDSASFGVDDVIDRMRLDKKAVAGNLRFVLPDAIGTVRVVKDVPESDVRAVLDEVLSGE